MAHPQPCVPCFLSGVPARRSPPTRTRGPKRKALIPAQRRLSSRQASFLFIRRPAGLTQAHHRSLEQISQASDELKQVYELSQQFVVMIRQRQAEQLDAWLEQVRDHAPRELKSFARGIGCDYEAGRAGLSRVENNGQVEGQITRLKYLKRQMDGRAKFDLLRLRVLHAA